MEVDDVASVTPAKRVSPKTEEGPSFDLFDEAYVYFVHAMFTLVSCCAVRWSGLSKSTGCRPRPCVQGLNPCHALSTSIHRLFSEPAAVSNELHQALKDLEKLRAEKNSLQAKLSELEAHVLPLPGHIPERSGSNVLWRCKFWSQHAPRISRSSISVSRTGH